MYSAWEAVIADATELVIPGTKTKMKMIVFMDMATKLRVVHPVSIYPVLDTQAETGEDVVVGLSVRWLACFPRPKILMHAGRTVSSGARVPHLLDRHPRHTASALPFGVG